MSVVVNNDFSRDSYGTRTERLIAIQGNFASIQPELNAPDEIAEWAEDCKDVFTELLASADVEKNQSESASFAVAEAEALMEEEYQNLRTLAVSIYVDHPKLFERFSFKNVFPDKRDDKLNRVESVLATHQTFVDNSITPLLPSTVVNRLISAKEDFDTALELQDKERGEAGLAQVALSERFESDTKKLNSLKSWWYAMMGKKDPRITWVGMVNPNTGGGNSNQIAAPTNFRYDYADRTVRWDAVSGATSYQLESSDDNTVWDVMYEGGDTEFFTGEMLPDHKFLRIRSRNANGFSTFATYNVVYEYVLNGPTNLTHNPALPGFTWDPVPNATAYEVQLRLASGTDDDYNLIYFGNDTTLIHGDPNGSYYVRARSWSNSGLSGWHLLAYSVGV